MLVSKGEILIDDLAKQPPSPAPPITGATVCTGPGIGILCTSCQRLYEVVRPYGGTGTKQTVQLLDEALQCCSGAPKRGFSYQHEGRASDG